MIKLVILLLISSMIACTNTTPTQIHELPKTDSISVDTTLVDSTGIVDVDKGSAMSAEDSIKAKEREDFVRDSLVRDMARRDSLHLINFKKITKRINGGYNGLADRLQIWYRAKEVLYNTEDN